MGETEELLKSLILSKYRSIREFTTQIGMPYSTLDSIFKRGVRKASVENIIRICDALNISADALANGTIEYKNDEQPTTIAAHFDGDEYTEEELDKIKEFAAFVKSTRKNEDKRAAQKAAAPAPAADAPLAFPDHLTVNAAHALDGATQEEKQHDDDIMDNDDEWK